MPPLTHFIPLLFVLLWSTGFIAAKYALPYIEPFYLLFIRMEIVVAVFIVLALVFKSRWPTKKQALHQMVTGSLVHAAYLGGVFTAIHWGLPAGVTALYVGLQPIVVAVLAWRLLKEQLRPLQWTGLILGLVGVTLVLLRGDGLDMNHFTNRNALIAGGLALLGISLGTLYQKRYGAGTDLITGSVFQYIATAGWMGLLAYGLETREVQWSPDLIGALAWLVIGLSVAAILLLMYMIREGETSKVAGYFYLVPPVTALESWLLFDERLNGIGVAGIGLVAVGVYLVIRKPSSRGQA